MNIIITGASKGIGYELAKQFASNVNNKVVIIARNRLKLEQLKRECQFQYPGAKIYPLVFDLSEGDYKHGLMPELLSSISSVDILINNAGVLVNKPFEELTRTDVETVYRTNVISTFDLIKALLPYMGKGQQPTHIVNISSMGGFQGSSKFPGLSAYSSSKAALANLTECLAEEFKGRNISVNCLCIGAVQTEMFAQAFPGEKANMQPAQMANYIHEFALNGATYFNGKVLPVSNSTP
ncbi:MAG TPA: SDR family oxidoreductase [Bacteroidia bacterium]|jgi:short-subunit dehydrogenase|nr:SDR family oxidoreductase [Bacteroidia bacterium]